MACGVDQVVLEPLQHYALIVMPASFLPIVYIEDDPSAAAALGRAFAQTRVPNELIIMRDGETGKGYFQSVLSGRKLIPALALIDLKLPKMSGLELIRWVRDQVSLKGMPVVALSEAYNYDDMERSYDFGANLYLLKPHEIRLWADLVFRLQGYWSTQADTYALGK